MKTDYKKLEKIVEKAEMFLIKKGMEKAKSMNLDIKIDNQTLSQNYQKDNLHKSKEAIELISMVAEEYPQITERYLANKQKLKDYLRPL